MRCCRLRRSFIATGPASLHRGMHDSVTRTSLSGRSQRAVHRCWPSRASRQPVWLSVREHRRQPLRHPRRLRQRRPQRLHPSTAARGLWINGIHLSAQLEAGIMGNPSGPADGLNFGHLFTDHANQVQLNQLLLTAQQAARSEGPQLPVGLQTTVHVWLRRPLYPIPRRAEPRRSEPALPARCGRGERAGAPALAHRGRHRPEGRASTPRRSATRRSIRPPIRSIRTPTSSSSACRSSTPVR